MIDKFIKHLLAQRHYSEHTASAYRRDLIHFCCYIGCEDYTLFSPDMVDNKVVRGYIMAMGEEQFAASSTSRHISSLRSLFSYLRRTGVVAKDPTIGISALRQGRRLPHFVEKSKARILLDASLELSDDFVIERDSLIVLLFYTIGIRLAELIGLDVGDVDMESLQVKVLGKGNKERISPIPLIVSRKLEWYLTLRQEQDPKESALIISTRGQRVSRSSVYAIVNNSLSMLGVEGKKSPHVLRHTFATHLLSAGVGIENIKELLGHQDLTTTQIYTHNSIEELKGVFNISHPRR